MQNPFKKATREQVRLRMALDGPAGSGKSFTALRMLTGLCKRIAVINSESGAIQKYLGLAPDGIQFDFDVVELTDYAPDNFTNLILAAGKAGYDGLLIDSLSHAWAGAGGALELKDKIADRNQGNSYTAWKDITPMHNRLIDAVLRSPCHVVATMRTKTEYIMEEYEDQGGRKKQRPKRVGLKSIQRDGMEYEFDVVGDLNLDHVITISKSRCMEMDGLSTIKPGVQFFEPLYTWLTEGSEIPAERFAMTEADLVKLEAARNTRRTTPAASAQPSEPAMSPRQAALAAAKKDAQPAEVAGAA